MIVNSNFLFVKLCSIARAERLRLCETCHPIYTRTFRIPDTWWTAWCRRCSVYFGSEDTVGDSGELDGHSMLFQSKHPCPFLFVYIKGY